MNKHTHAAATVHFAIIPIFCTATWAVMPTWGANDAATQRWFYLYPCPLDQPCACAVAMAPHFICPDCSHDMYMDYAKTLLNHPTFLFAYRHGEGRT